MRNPLVADSSDLLFRKKQTMLNGKIKYAAAGLVVLVALITCQPLFGQDGPLKRPLRVDPAPIASDKSVKYDYDIVYVRAPRTVKDQGGKDRLAMVWPDASAPFNMRASTDLMILHPDGNAEVL